VEGKNRSTRRRAIVGDPQLLQDDAFEREPHTDGHRGRDMHKQDE
jgi:hypothetical protein